ncbi:MAG TPA: hypothetical protein VFB68_07085 [Xanthobacteraceae bacterium]|nr:hypothetical protein [Xanthobacteraceae bacterium]
MALVGLCIVFAFAFPTYTHRYRMTVEIDTPDGIRSGSSVIEVKRKDYRWLLFIPGRYEYSVRGEAVLVDLGDGRNVIALLAKGPHAEDVDLMTTLAIEAYGYDKWDEEAWAGRRKMHGPTELGPQSLPAFVTFIKLDDPKTVQVVGPADFSKVFGPGVRLRRVWIESTNDPVTVGLELKLVWLAKMNAAGMGGRIDTYPGRFTINAPYFIRESRH